MRSRICASASRDRGASSISPICSIARPASSRPGRRPASSLAKALINRPDVLLLDEPTASLDPDTADWVRSHLERYRAEQSATVLLASHNMAEVERLCERVIIMKRGRIEDDDTPARAAGALRPRQSRRRVPRRRARPRRSRPRGRAMSESSTIGAGDLARAASARWCCAISICCARRGRACSS